MSFSSWLWLPAKAPLKVTQRQATSGIPATAFGSKEIQGCERLVELQQGAARSTEITISSICRELDEANQVARASGSASAMVSASTLRAKLAGLLTEKIKAEVEVSNVNKYEGKDTPKIAAMVAADLVDSFDNLSDADLVQLGLMLEEYAETVRQFIRSCRARSVSGYGGQRQIELARSPKGNGYKRIS
jgi:hypothetical protein